MPKPELVSHEPVDLDWNTTEPQTWQDDTVAVAPVAAAPAAAAAAAAPAPFTTTDDWSQQVQDELGANAAAGQPAPANWAGTGDWF